MKPKKQKPKKDSTIKEVLESSGINVNLIFKRALISLGVIAFLSLILALLFEVNPKSSNDIPDYMTTGHIGEIKPVEVIEDKVVILDNNSTQPIDNAINFITSTMWIWLLLPIVLMIVTKMFRIRF